MVVLLITSMEHSFSKQFVEILVGQKEIAIKFHLWQPHLPCCTWMRQAKTRTIMITNSNDAKMSCVLFGNPNAYCTTKGRPCFRCTARRGTPSWSDFTKHHFVPDPKTFQLFAQEDADDHSLSITQTNSQEVSWWTLEERRVNWEKVQKAKEDEKLNLPGASRKREELEAETQQFCPPITCQEPERHNLEIIHLIEGVCKRVCKLNIVECPKNSV